ncbi:hypothetical protein B9479_006887 [Cryptococcus floricola]|uniref:Alpha-mannosidase n=1 Tax=Cryptococcus floricola TaxID=2591691 RepID=A0A5D3AQU0_9TREE|nr:hypothetical protein B9479_006887 [Cryptococcus floricola]
MDTLKNTDYPQRTDEAKYKKLGSTGGRLNQFIGGHYAKYNLSSLLFAHRLDDTEHVKLEVWSAPDRSKPSFEEAKRQTYKPAKKGDSFGPSWSNHWFKVTLRIPKEWAEYERVQFEFDGSGEAMIFTTDGDPIHGLTGGFGGDRRVEFIVPQAARDAGVAHYYVESSCNGMFGIDNMQPPDDNRYYRLNSADLVVPNQEAWRLMWDFDAIHQIYNTLPGDSALAKKAQWVANEIMNVFEEGSLESVKKGRKVAQTILGEDWEKHIQDESEKAEKEGGTLWGVGHCHIDTAWLWPFSVTQQKAARSWSTQVDIMERYPEHRFSATQAQQFKWVEQLYPSLFARIQEKVSEGNFQPLGATWVEMDTNLPSGEALVRQFLYGQRYYESRFGFRSDTFVLPDTFGYSSQLPQISRQAGAKNFFTQKLSWNSINNFPHSTFNWVGLDGSQILTHMTPVDNYNSQCNIDDIRKGVTGHKNLDVTSQALLLFGNGDGGGGPTPPMLEKLRRARSVAQRPDAGGQLPLVKMGGSFSDFFDSVRDETKGGVRLPYWRGELYFELHRGTYTSHASIKKGNRKSEILMREAEYAATMATLADPDYKYPKDRFDAAWEDLLLCQFHDVLPGSGIAMIYQDAEKKYAALHASISSILEEALSVLYPKTKLVGKDEKAVGQVFAVNTTPGMARREVVKVELGKGVKGLKEATAQVAESGDAGWVLMSTGEDKSLAMPQGVFVSPRVEIQEKDDVFVMSNDNLSLKIQDGRITSVYDKALDKELIPQGQSGGLVIMEDHPNAWDAWDVDEFHLEKQTHLKFGSLRIKEQGPLRGVISTALQVGKSRIDLEIIVDAVPASAREGARSMIRFDAVVDWREKHRFLKFELPLDIYSESATYDTQFGTVSRPTHRNTSWDAAKFEVCAHKFADLSEFGYGVAILNDCKYGYATQGNVMRLSLLRAPTEPDADCDMGTHAFSFAIYPHKGTYTESDVAQVAYAFNSPLTARHATEKTLDMASLSQFATSNPFSISNAPNVQLDTIKRGEDDDFGKRGGNTKTLILRVYEHFGGHARAKLNISGLSIARAEIVNILEDHLEDLTVYSTSDKSNTSHLELNLRGYEVQTVKLTVKNEHKKETDGWVKL